MSPVFGAEFAPGTYRGLVTPWVQRDRLNLSQNFDLDRSNFSFEARLCRLLPPSITPPTFRPCRLTLEADMEFGID